MRDLLWKYRFDSSAGVETKRGAGRGAAESSDGRNALDLYETYPLVQLSLDHTELENCLGMEFDLHCSELFRRLV